MIGLLTEVGKKLTDKWMSLLVLPGLLYAGIVAGGWLLSVRGWSTPAERAALLTSFDTSVAAADKSPGRAIGVLAIVLLLSAVAGFGAQVLGAVARRFWLAQAPFGIVLRPLGPLRRKAWLRLDQRSAGPKTPAVERVRLINRRNAIGLAEPARPTWMGDRMAALATRVRNAYGLDLATAWPRLRLSLPDQARTDASAASDGFGRASVQAGWGLLYAIAGLVFALNGWGWWWVLGAIGIGTLLVGWWRGRVAVEELATVVESIVDVHAGQLAAQLGEAAATVLTQRQGELLNERYRKGS